MLSAHDDSVLEDQRGVGTTRGLVGLWECLVLFGTVWCVSEESGTRSSFRSEEVSDRETVR